MKSLWLAVVIVELAGIASCLLLLVGLSWRLLPAFVAFGCCIVLGWYFGSPRK